MGNGGVKVYASKGDKLSEFENDLYYPEKRVSFLKLTKDDFVYDVNRSCYSYILEPELDWLLTEDDINNFGFEITCKKSNSESTITEYHGYTEIGSFENHNMLFFKPKSYNNNIPIIFVNNGYYDFSDNIYYPSDSFNIETSLDLSDKSITEFNIELFKVDEGNKVPQEVLDLKNNYFYESDDSGADIIIRKDDFGVSKEKSIKNSVHNLLTDFILTCGYDDFSSEYFNEINDFIKNKPNGYMFVDGVIYTSFYHFEICKYDDEIYYNIIVNDYNVYKFYSYKYSNSTFTTCDAYESPQLSFNDAGELVVTIDGVSKVFAPKEATTLTVDESTGVLKVGASAASAE